MGTCLHCCEQRACSWLGGVEKPVFIFGYSGELPRHRVEFSVFEVGEVIGKADDGDQGVFCFQNVYWERYTVVYGLLHILEHVPRVERDISIIVQRAKKFLADRFEPLLKVAFPTRMQWSQARGTDGVYTTCECLALNV